MYVYIYIPRLLIIFKLVVKGISWKGFYYNAETIESQINDLICLDKHNC